MKKSALYMFAGVFFGLGAPFGALLLHALSYHDSQALFWSDEWIRYSFFYVYMAVGTCGAFGLFGYFLGREVDSLSKQNKIFSSEAHTDPLTGLGNHRFLHEVFKLEFRKHLDKHQPLSCLMMDLDLFKRVNDAHGHPFGDQVLKMFARIILDSIRQGDIATRYGGEEFLCILPNCGEDDARKVAERIRQELEKKTFQAGPYDVHETVSVGAATIHGGVEKNYNSLINEADKNLYEAKNKGRNRVVQSTLGIAPGGVRESGAIP